MNSLTPIDLEPALQTEPRSARQWVQVLAKYRQPSFKRSAFELAITLGPFVGLWALACWALTVSVPLAVAISLVNGMFLLRLFIIQHDCGHGSYLENRVLSDWLGRALGVLTLTPYDVWRRQHALHHSYSGNLDHRGAGDVETRTVAEYQAMTPIGRLAYRIYRHPVVMFGVGPFYQFVLAHRLPLGLMTSGWRYWVSAMGTNIALAIAVVAMVQLGGWATVWAVFLPTSLLAASVGVWLFYVQHQFETTHWESEPEWQVHNAALHGSSHYDLPEPFRWMTGNIGIHHVHHLYSRIPFYRLPEVLKDHAELVETSRLTFVESLKCARLNLWDEKTNRLISFSTARAQYS